MGKTILGVFLANVAMFAFGAAFWMSPIGKMAVGTAPDDAAAQAAIASAFPETGAYYVPGNMEASGFADLHTKGPLALVTVNHASGVEPMAPAVFIGGFVHGLVVIVFLAVLLKMGGAGFSSYGKRLGACIAVGLIGAIMINGGAIVWWYSPLEYAALSMVYNTSAITVAGIVLAAFVKPTT